MRRPLDEGQARDDLRPTLPRERGPPRAGTAARLGATVESSAGDQGGLSLVISTPGSVTLDTLYGAMSGLDVGVFDVHEIGSHASRFRLDSASETSDQTP